MEKTIDVFNIGLIVADLPLLLPYDVIDFSVDSTRLGALQVMLGGDAANTATVMSLLGAKTTLGCKLGTDHFGRILKSILIDYGVDTSHVKQDADTITGVSVVLINPKGERSFLYCAGNNNDIALEDIDLSALKQARHVNLASFLALPKLEPGGVIELFKEARRLGVTTSADVTSDAYRIGFEGIKESLRYVDYFMPSLAEARYLSGERDEERMADFFIRETGDKTVIIKTGANGCFVKSHGKCLRVGAYEAKVVDTTGAGDSFVAGFLFGLTNGWDLEQCADFANAVAAFSVQYVGATSKEMNLPNVTLFMENQPHK